jgi:maleate isomerase
MTQTPDRDTLAHRLLMGVVSPATNTVVQPEMEALRPEGVVNAHARIANPDQAVARDADTLAVRAAMVAGLNGAFDTLSPCRPDHALLAVMVENFVGGGAAAEALIAAAEARLGCPVTDVSSSVLAALAALFEGRAVRVGLLTPFMPVGDAAARRLFEEAGHSVTRLVGLRVGSPAGIARVPLARLREAVGEIAAGGDVDVIVQAGTNLPFAGVALEAEAELGHPVLASNPTTYWRALRRAGVMDRLSGRGVLFERA